MKSKDKEPNQISLDEELLMCCAYRYAIGRHTYVLTLADYIAKKYYDKLSPERLAFTAKDIRESINDCLRFGTCPIHYASSVPYDERNAFDDLMNFFEQNNISSPDDICKYSEIEVYKETYAKDAPKKFRILTSEPAVNRSVYQTDFDDLLPWYNLSQFFDKKHYYKVQVNYKGKASTYTCFKSWTQSTTPDTENSKYVKIVPFKWQPCYIDVDTFKKSGFKGGFINPDYIKNVKSYDSNS